MTNAMSDFIKPVRQKVKVSDGFAELLGKEIVKDLHDNEGICPTCHGVGMVIRDNPYGLSSDPDKRSGAFPYKRQAIVTCPTCYSGVVHYCPDCGKLIPKSRYQCDCKATKRRKYRQTLEAAQKHEPNALGTTFKMCYSDRITSHNEGFFSDWDEFFEAWWEEDIPADRPDYVWGTSPVSLTLDAYDILERATEDMYDGAGDEIGDTGFKALQDALDEWKKEYGCSDSYCEDRKHAIRIPWEDYTK